MLGGGLIGTELAMDLHRAGKRVLLVERADSLLASLMPAELSSRLQQKCRKMGIQLSLNNALAAVNKTAEGLSVRLENGLEVQADAVVAAVGLRPNVVLAAEAGLETRLGICVNSQLQTSDANIFALGDSAEIEGRMLPFLQPIQLSAMTLAKNLLGKEERLRLPALLVKVKTPECPLFLAGAPLLPGLEWDIKLNACGMLARGHDAQQRLRAFVISEDYTAQAIALLRAIHP
ncbi:Nitric oxide reductase FlRd-NAD(+) reductase [Sodalis praecaptivus]|nr:Nitric oxide reductase FlRd-NAD(+) reductase [Sodalis praecaptivus]